MKYVIFKRDEVVMSVIFHEHVNHCDVKIGDEWVPVSAGFVYMKQGRLEVDYKSHSESLGLKPNKTDGAVMTMLAGNYGVAMLMDQDNQFYPKVNNK